MNDLADRFWSLVEKSEGCWLWLGARKTPPRDYGTVYANGRNRPAAQVAWELANQSPFPSAMDACHTCDNPPCVRPDHIFPGTPSDNGRDAAAKGRFGPRMPSGGRCQRGHALAGHNLLVNASGRRCRACTYASNSRSRSRGRLARTAV